MPLPVQSLSDRFWSKADKSKGIFACWEWSAAKHKSGFGKFAVTSRDSRLAHHVAWMLVSGDIEKGKHVKQLCGNKTCVNPTHLAIAGALNESRFMSYVQKTDSCWEWIARKDRDGYGVFSLDSSENIRAHRFMWEIHNKKRIPKGLVVMHSCDNPSCVNPSHLSLGTIQDNTADMVSKGRQAKGEKTHKVKLTESQVKEIIKILARGERCTQIASVYGVSITAIRGIRDGATWKHISRV